MRTRGAVRQRAPCLVCLTFIEYELALGQIC